MAAQFLQQKWRLVTQWWQRQQNAYKELMVAYNRSVKEGKPRYRLLIGAAKLENECFERLAHAGLVPTKEQAVTPDANKDYEEALKNVWLEINARKPA